jgi:heparin/heparan-sulfate lyase
MHDRVVSRKPEFEKVWLYHSIEEPTVEANGFTVRRNGAEYGGALISRTLLPTKPRLVKIGGPGNEFRVGDINYATTKSGTCEPGAWRMEVSSAEKTDAVDFLHLFLVYPRTPESTPSARRIEGEKLAGSDILDQTVVFIKPEGNGKSFRYTSTGTGSREHLIIGLPADRSAAVRASGNLLGRFQTGSSGSIRFSLDQAGETEFRVSLE